MSRTYKGRNYSWRDCQREEFQCSVRHNNVIVTTRADDITQSGQYNFSCGGAGGRPVCFSVQVGVLHCQACQPHISLPAPPESGCQSFLCSVCLPREGLCLIGVWSDGLPSPSLHQLDHHLGGPAASTPPPAPVLQRAGAPGVSDLQPQHVRLQLLQSGGDYLLCL